MKKLEISDIIGILDGEEFRKLGSYISSPYFGISKRVSALYLYISDNYEAAVKGSLSRDAAAKAVLGNTYSDDNARKLFSDLNKTVEDFITSEKFSSDAALKQLMLLKALRKKGEMARHSHKLRELTKQLSNMEPDALSYRLIAEAAEEEFTAEDPADFHEYSEALQKWCGMLDAHYMSTKLLIYEYMFSKQMLNRSGKPYNWSMADEIFAHIEANTAAVKKDNPDIYLKYLMLKMIREKDDSLMVEYSEFLRENENRFSQASVTSYYSDLFNYATIRISRGRHDFRRPFLNLIKEIEPRGLILDAGGGKIHIYTFKQIADTAFNLKEIKWAGDFIERYKNKLGTNTPQNILSLMTAKLLYYMGNTAEARTELDKISLDDYILYLDAKSFRICLEYDEADFNACLMNIDALSKYLKHKKEIPENMIQSAKRFKHYIRKLIDFKENTADSFYLLKLAEEINGEDTPVYGKEWIRDKIEELAKK
ncbi:MAG: hypothetical protein JNK43_04825 [Ignavibacteria bacterium]|nr:hypothetical protein [Ignavibacteria bacterium]